MPYPICCNRNESRRTLFHFYTQILSRGVDQVLLDAEVPFRSLNRLVSEGELDLIGTLPLWASLAKVRRTS
jgi:hypothetical protein